MCGEGGVVVLGLGYRSVWRCSGAGVQLALIFRGLVVRCKISVFISQSKSLFRGHIPTGHSLTVSDYGFLYHQKRARKCDAPQE